MLNSCLLFSFVSLKLWEFNRASTRAHIIQNSLKIDSFVRICSRIGRKLQVSLISLNENEFPRSIINVAVCHASRLSPSCRKTNSVREFHSQRGKRQIGRKERNIENVVHAKIRSSTLQFSFYIMKLIFLC